MNINLFLFSSKLFPFFTLIMKIPSTGKYTYNLTLLAKEDPKQHFHWGGDGVSKNEET